MTKIVTVNEKKDEKNLRQKTVDFDFSKFSKKEINDLIQDMKKTMVASNGVGLSANQIGLQWRVFVAQVPVNKGESKFYALFNPSILKTSKEEVSYEEGCLSVPGKYGEVSRPYYVIVKAQDKNGRPVKIKAWALLARVFQHEIDHLNGGLFIDKAKNIQDVSRPENS
ncbi:peptide deformylase [Patescibacteria group bacterium]|nr:peptide deformylase [Patescibacteria group bacterium]MCL5733716.1 peptide deformylase [Patescibacteria group bacterium]